MKRTHSGIVRVERVQVFIGGVSSSDAAALTTYLHQFSGFVGHISVTVFNGFARAVFAGGGAHRGVLATLVCKVVWCHRGLVTTMICHGAPHAVA